MSDSIFSPGVVLIENDQSQYTQGPIEAGAAIVGPTVIGPVNTPTLVTSYSEYKAVFGASFITGGASQEYLTSIAAYNYFNQGGSSLLVTRVASGSYTSATANVTSIGNVNSTTASFQLETISTGVVMNNSGAVGSVGNLITGSDINIRWEISAVNTGSGVFSIIIRRGDDTNNNKTILETWNNLSLDPNQNNYIEYVIGSQKNVVQLDFSNSQYYIQPQGAYQNKSKYVRVIPGTVAATPNYFDAAGNPVSSLTGSMPRIGSGSLHGAFSGATGAIFGFANSTPSAPLTLNQSISGSSVANSAATNVQGLLDTDYAIAINLLRNKDEYQFNVITAPGLNSLNAPSSTADLISLAADRGDNIAVVDMVGYSSNLTSVISQASTFDNSYAATYWPWVQVRSVETGRIQFVPPATVIPSVYEYNDKVAAAWWAPAGVDRGGLGNVIQPERKVSLNDRNLLYAGKVNPIASFPGVGVAIYGQKTLQSKNSALNRVSVRRLLIELKSYIGQIGQTLVFQPNTQVTRNKFLNQVNPYLESVQQREGLYAFEVIMDDTNNTPDTIDRGILVGAINIKPTIAAEIISLTFNIMPTGTTFNV
jgi:phage tail sheath protein FI